MHRLQTFAGLLSMQWTRWAERDRESKPLTEFDSKGLVQAMECLGCRLDNSKTILL